MNNKASFIRGALILAAANIISKILGAVFKIPLTYILKEDGMAVFSTASSVYSIFLAFVISGIPLASSRLISADTALNRHGDAVKTTRASAIFLMFTGGAASILLYLFSVPLAAAMKDPEAALSIKIISPSVFFVAWGAAYKSYFQGLGSMTPTAVSQVLEAVLRLLTGYFLARFFIKYSVSASAAAAISGVTAGEIFATLILFFSYLLKKRKISEKSNLKFKKIYSSLLSIAIPMLICTVTLSALNLADMATVRNQLLRIRFSTESAHRFLLKYSAHTSLFDNLFSTLRLSSDGARWLYGAYSGYALTVFHLPLGVISTLSVSILPVIAGALAKNNTKAMHTACRSALNLTFFCSVPFCVLFFTASKEILFLLFHNTASAGMLSAVSPCLIFLSLSQLVTSVFHAAGNIYEPFILQLLGIIIKILLNIFLVKIPFLNIDGAILSSLISFSATAVLLLLLLYRRFGVSLSANDFLPPLLSAVPMWIVLRLTLSPLQAVFKNRYAALVFAAFVSGIAYLLCISVISPGRLSAIFPIKRKKDRSK